MQMRIGGSDVSVAGPLDRLSAEIDQSVDMGSLRRGADVTRVECGRVGVWGRRSDHRGLITVQRQRKDPAPGPAELGEIGVDVMDEPPGPVAISWGALIPSVAAGLVMSLVFSSLMAILAGVSATVMIGRSVVSRILFRRRTRKRATQLAEYDLALTVRLREWSSSEAERRRLSLLDPATLVEGLATGGLTPWSERLDASLLLPLGLGEVGVMEPGPAMLVEVPIEAKVWVGRGLAVGGDRSPSLKLARWLVVYSAVTLGPADLRLMILTTADRLIDWDWVKWLPGATILAASSDEADSALAAADDSTLVVVDGLDPAGPGELAMLLSGRSNGEAERRMIWLGLADEVPAGCASQAEVWPDGSFRLAVLGGDNQEGKTHGLTATEALEAALALAPLDDPEAMSTDGGIPGSCVLGELVEVYGADQWGPILKGNWANRDRTRLLAPIGMDRGGVVSIDLVADGPHALVAGTTGSGKSELLRTLVAGLATSHPPSLVNLVLIDFKGGGAFDVVAGLPHVAAVVTDLDASESARALRSLRAELHSREEILRSAEVSDIGNLPESVKLPRLVVVVDEFAALADELPDFLEGLVDVARRGRSLGVHLVLATQRPAGVVTGQIRANTALRICLRVQDAADSTDVVDSPDGANLPPVPGRAIMVRQGHRSDLQVARVGHAEGGIVIRPFVCHPSLLADAPDEFSETPIETEGLVAAARLMAGRYRASPPWAPLLDERPSWLAAEEALPEGQVGLGWLDDPDTRSHRPVGWDPEAGGLLVVGSELDRLARTVELACTGHARLFSDAPVYVVDGVGSLSGLADLAAVGDVIPATETERVSRLISSMSDPGPRLLILHRYATIVDQLSEEIGPEAPAVLARLIRDGAANGLRVVATAGTDRDLGSRVAGLFSQRMVHRLSDPAAYLSLEIRPAHTDGLGVNDIVEPGTGRRGRLGWLEPDEFLGLEMPEPTSQPDPVVVLGGSVSRGDLPEASRSPKGWIVPVGVDSDLAPRSILVSGERPLVVVGQPGSGRSTALATARAAFADGEACIIDDADLLTKLDGETILAAAAEAGQPVLLATTPAALRGFGGWIAPLVATATVILLNPSRTDGEAVRAIVPDLTSQPIGRSILIDRGRQAIVQIAS